MMGEVTAHELQREITISLFRDRKWGLIFSTTLSEGNFQYLHIIYRGSGTPSVCVWGGRRGGSGYTQREMRFSLGK